VLALASLASAWPVVDDFPLPEPFYNRRGDQLPFGTDASHEPSVQFVDEFGNRLVDEIAVETALPEVDVFVAD